MIQRNTIQHSIILDVVKKFHGHATAEEVYQLVHEEYPNISKATVYRNLNRLAEMNEIRKVEVFGGAQRFDCRRNPHYHVKCQCCEEIFDVDMEYMDNLKDQIKNSHGFEFINHDIMFTGICPRCKESASNT